MFDLLIFIHKYELGEIGDHEHSLLFLEVEDSGMGISDDNLKKLWTSFSRSDKRQKYRGLGLGLSIVSKLVQAFHGCCGCRSKVGGIFSNFCTYVM